MGERVEDLALIVVGGSAGSIEPLIALVRGLPADIPAALCVVVHFPSQSTSLLPRILSRKSKLPAKHAEDGEGLQAGCIYVAPPDYHLLVADGRVELTDGPRQNGHRPAIDPLFRTAARSFGARTIGVILSGSLDDGSQGLMTVKRLGGVAVVQDPEEALFGAMPANALAHVRVDHVVPAARLAGTLSQLARERAALKGNDAMGEQDLTESELVAAEKAAAERGERAGQASMLSCPDCGGVLWELQEGELLRYRCHVGHAYSAESLEVAQNESLEGALWTAVRALEESAALARRLATRARQAHNQLSAEYFDQRARGSHERAELVRRAISVGLGTLASPGAAAPFNGD